MHGLTDLSVFDTGGWHWEQLELPPSARLTTTAPTASRMLPDSVLRPRRGEDVTP
ncbi:hypothetical protein [Streptomyces cucumeris]|uniref:hypothetical protein n=1 Tax=Streptomyces cucumeris TaxID=2962890 RepID=UPI0020C8835C|nr:hypothetical protein [Streptomyces sp. NEAU-Y11]MCP9213432.1 hypothetical protein [Streptomyces sp. NEAU-Y11]